MGVFLLFFIVKVTKAYALSHPTVVITTNESLNHFSSHATSLQTQSNLKKKKKIFDPTTSTWAKKRKTKESQFQLNTTTSSINKMTLLLLLSMAPSKVLPTTLHRFHRSTSTSISISISLSLWSACLSLLLRLAPPSPLLLLLLSTMLRAIKPFQVLLLLFVLFESLGFSLFWILIHMCKVEDGILLKTCEN